MKKLKVKDILDIISADNIEVLQIHYYASPKPTHRETLYKYFWDDELGDFNERIYDKDFQNREVECILAIDSGTIQVRVFPLE